MGGVAHRAVMAYCPHCGGASTGGAFCSNCGKSLSAGPAVQMSPPATAPGQVFSAVPVHVSVPPKTSGMAIGSLVCGILGILTGWIPVVGVSGWALAIVAIALGIAAVGQINRSPAHFAGKGMAVTGIVLGSVTIGFAILFLTILATILQSIFGVIL